MASTFSMTELIAGLLGSGGLVQAAHWFGSRRKVRADTFETTVNTLQLRLGHTEKRLDDMEAKVDECEGKHSECEDRLRATNMRLGDAEREIERLMKGPVATYKPRAPKC